MIEETEMNKQNLIIELESKSIMPNPEFLIGLQEGVEDALKELNRSNGVTLIDDDDWDISYSKMAALTILHWKKATEIALKQTGIAASTAVLKIRRI